MPNDPFNTNSAQWNLFRTSSVDVDALIESANQAFNGFGWTKWLPGPDDEVIVSVLNVNAPLTSSIVREYADFRAWLEGRTPTQDYIDAVEIDLRGMWWTASINRRYVAVAQVLRDLFLWEAIGKMPERDREAVRPDLVRRLESSSTPVTDESPRESDPKKDWMEEHAPGRNILDFVKPIPPFRLG